MIKKTIVLKADIGDTVYSKEEVSKGNLMPYKVKALKIFPFPEETLYGVIRIDLDVYWEPDDKLMWVSGTRILTYDEAKKAAIEYHTKCLEELKKDDTQDL